MTKEEKDVYDFLNEMSILLYISNRKLFCFAWQEAFKEALYNHDASLIDTYFVAACKYFEHLRRAYTK